MKRSVQLLLIAASSASAQGVTLRGTAYDSLHSRPLSGALVAIGNRTTTTDSAGHFSFENVAPGTYRITAQHDAIDRLGMSAIGTQARVTDGQQLVRVAIPSFATLWKAVCGPTPPASDTGFIFGSLRHRDSARGKAIVAASWRDIVSNGRTVSQKQKTLEVDADSLGNYTLCGIPTHTGVTLQATADSAQSGLFDLDPMDKERVMRRDLALGLPLDQVVEKKRGGRLTGTVVADSGAAPLANAKVSLDGVSEATTNERGEFTFSDILPGSHRLYVRRIGFGEIEQRLDLEEAEEKRHRVVLGRVTLLDSMAVVAKPLAREEGMRVFEEHRKMGLGVFLTAAELEKAGPRPLSSMVATFRGIYIPIRPGQPKVPQARRGPKSLIGGSSCVALVFLDGVRVRPPLDIDDYPPATLAGVEWFPGSASIPAEYNIPGSACGVFAMHSRYKTGK